MQALDGYKACHTIPRVKMEFHSPTSIPRSLSPVSIEHHRHGQYSNYSPSQYANNANSSPILSYPSPTSPSPTSFSSPSNHRLKREYDYVNVDTTPLKMDPFGYEGHADSWNNFLYNNNNTDQQQQQQQQQQQHLLFNEHDDMNAPQPFTIFPTSYGVSQGNLNQQLGMISHQQQQQWDMNMQYPQAYYPTTPLSPGQPIPHMTPSGPSLMPMSSMSAHQHQQLQQQAWSNSVPPQYTNASPSTPQYTTTSTSTRSHGGRSHSRIQHQHIPSPPSTLTFAPIVPSSSPNNGAHHNNGNDSSDNDLSPSTHPTLSTRYATAISWLTRTSPSLTPTQITIAHSILHSPWWTTESSEPELLATDELILKGLIATPGGSRFRAFLDEERGWRCTFDHDGVVCGHGKGRMERALGTIRGFFVYKPVVCGGGCGGRCEQRFVSVEQCQKHVQKKRSGRVACPECGSSILPANMSRHRRACHAA